MWNKRNAPEPQAHPVQPDPGPAQPRPAAAPVTPPQEPPRQSAVIGSSMAIKGEIHSKEELYVDGEVEGKLELQHRLTVGPSGKIRATVKAKEVVVLGSINGNVQASDKIVIKRSGSLVGDIRTAGIVIDDGAYFKGSIDIVKGEAQREAASQTSAAD